MLDSVPLCIDRATVRFLHPHPLKYYVDLNTFLLLLLSVSLQIDGHMQTFYTDLYTDLYQSGIESMFVLIVNLDFSVT